MVHRKAHETYHLVIFEVAMDAMLHLVLQTGQKKWRVGKKAHDKLAIPGALKWP